MFKTTPDDPRIVDMDPVQKIWMYQHWIADQNDQAELAKNHAYLVGSFYNPEAVKQLMNQQVHTSTDEEFEESWKIVEQAREKSQKAQNNNVKKRKRIIKKTP